MFKFNKKSTIIILLLILLFGGGLRFYKLGSQSYWMDEGYTVNAVISGAENGFTKSGASILDSGQTYACPMYCLPTLLLGAENPANPLNFRILAAIFGILAILVIFLVAKQLFNNDRIALLSAFFMAASYWQIAWSRQARWYTELLLFTWLAIYFFIKSDNSKSSAVIPSAVQRSRRISFLFFTLAIIFTILAIFTHKVAILLPFIFALWLIIERIIKNKRHPARGEESAIQSKQPRNIFIFITAAILIALPFIISPGFFSHAIAGIDWSYNLPYYLNFYLRNYFIFIIPIIFYFFSLPSRRSERSEESKSNSSINFSLRKVFIFLSLIFTAYLVPLSFLTGIVHYRYLFFLTPVFFILGAAAIIGLSEKLFKKENVPLKKATPKAKLKPRPARNHRQILFISAAVLLFFIFKQGVLIPRSEYFLESDNPAKGNRPYYAYTPQPDFNWAYQVIKDKKQPDEIVISSHPHFNKIFLDEPGYWLKYDYLGLEDGAAASADISEFYAGALIIDDLAHFQDLTGITHGYVVFDYMAQDGRIAPEIINYIESNTNYAPASYEAHRGIFELLFSFQTNYYSRIWVYRF